MPWRVSCQSVTCVCIPAVFVSFDVLGVCRKVQRDYLSGKLGNVTEFDSCRGNVKKLTRLCQLWRAVLSDVILAYRRYIPVD